MAVEIVPSLVLQKRLEVVMCFLVRSMAIFLLGQSSLFAVKVAATEIKQELGIVPTLFPNTVAETVRSWVF